MSPDEPKILPAAAKKQGKPAVARSVRQVHHDLLQALRIPGPVHLRLKALVTGIQYSGGDLYIALFDADLDYEDHWILGARVDPRVREALEDQIGGPFGQQYLAAEITADVELAMTKQFAMKATIMGIIAICPYRDL